MAHLLPPSIWALQLRVSVADPVRDRVLQAARSTLVTVPGTTVCTQSQVSLHGR
jgi:hypothetical protein